METTHYPRRACLAAFATFIFLLCFSTLAFSQSPLVTVRFANPAYDCLLDQYCLDVEFLSPVDNIEIFGMNVRFFYDDANLELTGFSDFQGGYGPVNPNPPTVTPGAPGTGTTLFGFPPPGIADFVNGAIQLVDDSQTPIILDDVNWSKIFQVCFVVEGTIPDSSSFCPPIVWDLEANPANGGFLAGDDGVVITMVTPPPSMSAPVTENVVQFNWAYSGPGTPPYGAPLPTQCVSLFCPVDLALTKDLDAGQDNLQPGDDVQFTITVTNEGMIPVSSIDITDYIPAGFTLNDPDWTAGVLGSTGQSASITLSSANGALPPGGLLTGGSVTVGITLQIDASTTSGLYENFAEISAVFDTGGNDVTNQDSDSTPDVDDTNDPDAEDDHDGAIVCLLLPPVINGNLFACQGDTITYFAADYDASFTYVFTISGGGTITSSTDSSVTIVWTDAPGSTLDLTLTVTAIAGCEATVTVSVIIEEAAAIACIDHINVSLENNCGTVILSGMILTGEEEGNNTYQVYIIDMNGDTVKDATLTWEHVGQTFKVSVVSVCTGQSCWGWMTVEDKLGPQINCICPVEGESEGQECDITCIQIASILDGDIPRHLVPRVIDNCGNPTLELVNVELHYETCTGGYILTEWLATDIFGNTSSCEQQYNIIPLTLETLQFPPDYDGECGDSSDPSNTGYPQVNGDDITLIPGHCNIISSYSDRTFPMCGGGTKIMRTWTVFDWCVPTSVEHVQFIILADQTGPVITCPQDITVSTGVWGCYANVVITRPPAIDACSGIESYKVKSSAGVVTAQGNSFAITQIPIGKHTITWTITDICHNSSTCSYTITVIDNVPPVAVCHLHTVVALTDDLRLNGLAIVPADVFDDGSYDNCGPVYFRARRMTSCLEFDWTTQGACEDEIPGGHPPIDSRDHGTVLRDCVPFACCDIGQVIMIELEVSDIAGNKNYCMVEVEVQDKLAPAITCPEEIFVSCEFPFVIEEGIFSDVNGNNDGTLDEDPLSEVFGNMYDAARHLPIERQHIVINDPDNTDFHQPHDWGLEGWADDNCEVQLSVEVRVIDDCTGNSFPGKSAPGAVKLIERLFKAYDGVQTTTCLQRIWVVDYERFYISDSTCFNENPFDGVIWPCDVTLTSCEQDLGDTGEPIILNDGCSIIGISSEDHRFDFVDGVCYKIIREWKVLDWCQYDQNTGYGLWTYNQTIKVADAQGVEFLDAPSEPVSYCLSDPGISLPDNNQIFLGENNPASSSCSVHVDLGINIRETCSGSVTYDVKVYPFNGSSFIQLVPETVVQLDANDEAEIRFNTETCGIPSIEENGLPYTSPECGDYHRIVWTVEDGCGNASYADYLFRLEDCKDPTPVCIDGISTVIMPVEGEVIVVAASFDASSNDDCTPGAELLFSFDGDTYQPTFTYTCDNVPVFDAEFPVEIWAADGGADLDCDGEVEWSERNKDFCITTLVITDNNNVCDNEGGILGGEIVTELTDAISPVTVGLSRPGGAVQEIFTGLDGRFLFNHIPQGTDYKITPQRNDNHRNGVSTLDLVAIQKHLLGRENFSSPYQYIAADVNSNQSVSAADMIEIRKIILGVQDEFANNQSWRFVRKGSEMAEGHPWPFTEQIEIHQLPSSGNLDMDFVGVKIGDVNHSVKANASQLTPKNNDRILHVKATGKSQVEIGEEIEVELVFPEVVEGFQWTMEAAGLELTDIFSEDIAIEEQHTGYLSDGIITMSWNGDLLPQHTSREGMAIRLKFKALAAGRLMNMLDITSEITPAEAYAVNGETMGINLTFNSAGIFAEYALYQNKPNPWNNHTLIGFHLPVDATATLSIYDMDGKIIKAIQGQYKSGYNSVTLTTDDLPASGVYYYRLESNGFVASKKMVMVK